LSRIITQTEKRLRPLVKHRGFIAKLIVEKHRGFTEKPRVEKLRVFLLRMEKPNSLLGFLAKQKNGARILTRFAYSQACANLLNDFADHLSISFG
jgi:hypothetical protein